MIRPGRKLHAACVDFPRACKNVGVAPAHEAVASVAPGPYSGPLLVAKLSEHPICSPVAPSKWGLVTAPTKWEVAKFFGIAPAVLTCDCFTAEGADAAESAS